MSTEEEMVAEVEIKSSAGKFHQVFACRPQDVPLMTDKVLGCDLNAGKFGTKGVVVTWTYIDDRKTKKTAREIFEEIDYENYYVTMKVIEGDLMREFKNFKLIVKATPKGEGSVVSWTLLYRKTNNQTPNPQVLLDYLIQISKDIDVYLQNH